MRNSLIIPACFLALTIQSSVAQEPVAPVEREFIDKEGRKVTAYFLGVNRQNVVMRRGKAIFEFPLKDLSEKDQEMANEWKKNPPSTRIRITTMDRDRDTAPSRSPFSTDVEMRNSVPTLGRFGGGIKEQKVSDRKYYEITLQNTDYHVATGVELRAVILVKEGHDQIRNYYFRTIAKDINPGSRQTLNTFHVTMRRTTTESTEVIRDVDRTSDGEDIVKYYEKKVRDTEIQTLGGIWIKAFQKGVEIGEVKRLHPTLEHKDVAWPNDEKWKQGSF